ncbi:MAG: nuclease-related domain-containing protein [Akkermansiaceae bacterium]
MLHLLPTLSKIDPLQHLRPFWWLIPILITLYITKELSRSPKFKGWLGEKIMYFFSLKKLNPEKYKLLHDLYLPRPDGTGTTQIDHLVISPHGIFVIETKNYTNWIFGTENQRQWTQQIYKNKYKFQNPIHQNDLHINALTLFLNADKSLFHNLIFFVGNTTFKTKMPPNVLNQGFRKHIESHTTELLTQQQANHIHQTLLTHDQSLNRKQTAKQHIKDLKTRTKN